MPDQPTLLRIDASARTVDSVTRALGDRFTQYWLARQPGGRVVRRDLVHPLPLLDEAWIEANFTDPAARDEGHRAHLALSDQLIGELRQADEIVVGVPLYNFGVPASLKAWVDLVCRARETFAYTAEGPVGLLDDRPVTLLMASGGVPIGSSVDFASGYLTHIFGFIGITDVRRIAAERLGIDPQAGYEAAQRQLDELFDNSHRAA